MTKDEFKAMYGTDRTRHNIIIKKAKKDDSADQVRTYVVGAW